MERRDACAIDKAIAFAAVEGAANPARVPALPPGPPAPLGGAVALALGVLLVAPLEAPPVLAAGDGRLEQPSREEQEYQ